ncbi:Stk1 family PASTA domain-containing Ser/Thr kinase [Glycomyces algeriensis]|uniref:Stk1 family PASTA domain-containing Ser/Thr kinase n=1 Tax=Glycomyces algeriensis TaxID=256037 RepID=UPI0022DA5163|nr:Stk1 family PASTA domain-containing Ser/Thr kinase [Glycomyces algeriensis]MDA1365233.1 PASTA domain-containing protein [Glycomyces algeriensis]MDR7349703.1 serine/threonine-protein kinase [Glycomyces algeriensis]
MTTTTGDLTGARVDGRYRLERLIARGGMADVYEARDERLERTVAVKIITNAAVAGFDVKAFANEAKTIARLSHPNVVAVFDQGVHEGLPYVVMEYVPGTTLRDLLNRRRRLRIDEAVELCVQVLDGLQAAHDAGLVHRDIKPENILLKNGGRGDRVKVVDFGLAEAVHGDRDTGGPLVATAAYVAPELVNGKPATTASDVYSTAILLYELLTGEVPFDGPDSGAVARRHVDEDVPTPQLKAPDVSDGLAELVTTAAARRPGARPVDAGAFLRRLQAVDVRPAKGSTGKVPRPTRVVQTTMVVDPPGTKRSWKALLTLGLIALLLVGVAAAGWWIGIGRYTATPSLLDQSRESVAAYAEEEGFEVDLVDGYSESVPVGGIISQEPGVGDRIRRGATITVVVSQGPERYQVPNLAGMTEDEARGELAAFSAEIEVEHEYSVDAKAGEVTRTDPTAGEEVKAGTPVTLYVSDGYPPNEVPDVVGLTEADARAAIETEGLPVGEVTRRTSDTIAEGLVIEQDPSPASPVGPENPVNLVISSGPEMIEVPDVVGMDLGEATDELEGLGFTVKTAQIWFSGTVFDQSIDGGTDAEKGAEIWLWAN